MNENAVIWHVTKTRMELLVDALAMLRSDQIDKLLNQYEPDDILSVYTDCETGITQLHEVEKRMAKVGSDVRSTINE